MSEFKSEEKFIVHHCNTCGVSYALTESYDQQRRKDHKTFYCPSGHSHYFPQESDIEKANRLAREAQEKADRLQQCIDHKKNIIKRRDFQMRYYKGEVTKLKNKRTLK